MAYIYSDRMQLNLFPPSIEDLVGAGHPVRVYDAFIESVDLKQLGIPIEPVQQGATAYHPKILLKILVYGYSYGVRSSRKLERACHDNISFQWLTGGLKPDYRTISRFRSTHKKAIKQLLKQSVRMCLEFNLIEGNTVFIDGSAFRANASIKHHWTKEKYQKHLKELDESIDQLIDQIENLDHSEENKGSLVQIPKNLQDAAQCKERMQELLKKLEDKEHEQKMTKKVTTTLNHVDDEAVKMKSRQGTHACYNAQLVTDQKHGLIISADATSQSSDAHQLKSQIEHAKENLGRYPKEVSSDSGYYDLDQLSEIPSGIVLIIPSQKQSRDERRPQPANPFDKNNFSYNPQKDIYTCPAGKTLTVQTINQQRQAKIYQAKASDCRSCQHFKTCTTSPHGRRVSRTKYYQLQEQLAQRYQSFEGQKIYKQRKEKAEAPFGHFKHNLAASAFLLRGRDGTQAEISLLSCCLNLTRMITILGAQKLIHKLKEFRINQGIQWAA
jgi:transposase